jgi:hypothetical protein
MGGAAPAGGGAFLDYPAQAGAQEPQLALLENVTREHPESPLLRTSRSVAGKAPAARVAGVRTRALVA